MTDRKKIYRDVEESVSHAENDLRLSDWGEFRLLNELVLPIFHHAPDGIELGNDVAYIEIPGVDTHLAVTSDVAPKPLVWSLGQQSYWSWGWYSVLASVSDLASAAAEPCGFTSSVEAPDSMLVEDFRQFFGGMAAACSKFDIPNAGGNIRTAPRFECHGTAIGLVSGMKHLSRSGCKPGDKIAVVGDCGLFISAYLKAKAKGISSLSERDQERLFRPKAQVREMITLVKTGAIHAASDNSDGILGAVWNIAERSECAIELDMDEGLISEEVRTVATAEKVDPWNLMFFWGDWQVVVAIDSDMFNHFRETAAREEITYTIVGQATEGAVTIHGIQKGRRKRMNILRNENFISHSYNCGIENHVDYMLHAPIFAERQ